MDAKYVVIIAGIILMVAIVGSLFLLRGYSGRFTFDTKNGTRPRASEGEGNTPGVTMKGRFQILTIGVGAVFAALVAKLWSMQMVSSDYYEALSRRNQTRTVSTPAPRGRILDRNGIELVTNRPSLIVGAYRDLASDSIAVRHLANVLGMPYTAVRRNILDYNQSAQSIHTVASDVRLSTVAHIREHAAEFKDVHVEERTQRVYPYGTLACHVLGYTGTITSEQLKKQEEAQGGDERQAGSVRYQSGDIVGQAGVEIRYESLLQGIRGEQVVQVDASGNVVDQTAAVPPRAGSDIKLTLDLKIQQACEEGLKRAMEVGKQTGYTSDAGACICIDCTNGDILGMASAPSFDPSVFIGGVSNDDWSKLNGEDSGNPLLNRCISGQYMSASTVKPLSSLAALEYGIYSPTQTTTCNGWWTGLGESAGRWCWDHAGHGTLTLQQGIAHSCDPVFYDIGKGFFYDEKNPEGLQEVFKRWGLGSATDVDLPSEASGRVPTSEWKKEFFSEWTDEERAWNPGDMLNIVIGQGDILVTPLQMATVYCGIANGGKEFKPHVFHSAVSRDGEGDAVLHEPEVLRDVKVHDKSDMELVKAGLHGVIYEASASTASHFNGLGVQVAGKSGTGERSDEDLYAWFITYAPADDPKYVVVTLVERGGFGSSTALVATRYVLGQIYGVEDSVTAVGGDMSR
ncbi:MAG: penicillin-binding protein 2 [Collinsella sp.]|nr:penicillin-binding protein 2 [Collinsella sp.]